MPPFLVLRPAPCTAPMPCPPLARGCWSPVDGSALVGMRAPAGPSSFMPPSPLPTTPYPSIHPDTHPFIHPLTHSFIPIASIHLLTHPFYSIHPSVPPTHPSTHPSNHLSFHPSPQDPIHLSTHPRPCNAIPALNPSILLPSAALFLPPPLAVAPSPASPAAGFAI